MRLLQDFLSLLDRLLMEMACPPFGREGDALPEDEALLEALLNVKLI